MEGIVVGGELQTLAVLDKPDPMEGPFFEETILVTPSRLPETVQLEIVSCVQRSVAILGLDDGPVHAELRVDAERASLLEIAPRSIGGRCSTILRFEPEATLEELILHHALGMPIDEYSRAPGAGGVMMLPIPEAGILREVGGSEAALEIPGIPERSAKALYRWYKSKSVISTRNTGDQMVDTERGTGGHHD